MSSIDEEELLRSAALQTARSIFQARERAEAALREQSEWLRITLASIGDGVISTTADGRVTFLNAVAETLTGWTQADAVGRLLPEVFDIVDETSGAPIENPALRAQRQGATIGASDRTVLRAKDRVRRPIEESAAPIRDRDGVAVGAVLVFRDVTERKRAEAALREGDRRKDEFIALLAHELRNPLAPLRNGLQVMRLAGDDAHAVAMARATMERQLGHMVRLIDDLLDVSRIGQDKMELRRTRVLLAEAVGHAVETSRPVIEAAEHLLSVSLPTNPVYLDADLTRLAQVLSNLLTNSAKYTRRGGRIWLTGERRGDQVVVSVRDNGVGIPDDALAHVFDMFSQVDRNTDRSSGGLGIGLALVKGLTEMHGGSVRAESPGPGQGSTFTLHFPALGMAEETVPDEPVPNADRPQRPPRRILVADDNVDSAVTMASVLTLLGDEVHVAHDGVEALELAENLRPEVILMDVGMPRMNGYEAARRIRSQGWGRRTVIIALTGWGQDDDRQLSREAGCDGHLVKPVDLPDLENMLDELLPGVPRA